MSVRKQITLVRGAWQGKVLAAVLVAGRPGGGRPHQGITGRAGTMGP